MKIYTIGYTKKSAEEFFNILTHHKIKQVVDVRENNTSQLAGFTKKDDLRFFLKVILNISYIHLPELAPDKAIRESYKKNRDWQQYKDKFLLLMKKRNISARLKAEVVFTVPFVLLCSEPSSDHCHRRLVAEVLKKNFYPDAEIIHL